MASKRKSQAMVVDRIRRLAVERRYPADWIAVKLELEKYPRPNGRWSAKDVKRIAAQNGIDFFPHRKEALKAWRPGPRRPMKKREK